MNGKTIRKAFILTIVATLFLGASCEQPHNHSWNAEITSLPTCTEEGVITYKCLGCNATREEKSPATGHAEAVHITTKESTCTTEGAFEDKCPVCGEILKSGTIEKTDHVPFPIEIITEATCTKDGVAVCVCRDCMAELGTTTYPKKGHTASETVVIGSLPTCTEDGENHILCKECGEIMEDIAVEKLGHAWGETSVTKAPTCSQEGSAERECSRCGQKNFGTIAKLPHTWDGNIIRDIEPNCKNDGVGHISCVNCDAIQNVTFPATGEHTLVPDGDDTPATEYSPAIAHKICTVCGDKFDVPYGEPLGHIHSVAETVDVPGTCSSAGKKIQYCSCYTDEHGNIYQEDGEGRERYVIQQDVLPVDPNNHSYGAETIKPNGFTRGSVSYRYCSGCAHYEGNIHDDAESFVGTWNFTGDSTGYITINAGYGEDSQSIKEVDFKTSGSITTFSGTCVMAVEGQFSLPGTWETKARFSEGSEIDELWITIPTVPEPTAPEHYMQFIMELGPQNTETAAFKGTMTNIEGHPTINISRGTL